MGGIRSPAFATVPMYTKRVVPSWPSFFTASIRCRVPPKLTSIDDHYTLMSRRPVSLKNSSRESTLVTVSTVE